MRAWVCDRFAVPYEIECREMPVPHPGPDDVQVAMRAAGLAFGETVILEGHYQVTPPMPYILGNECSGTVMSVGKDVTAFKPGDRVVVVGFTVSGGMAADVVTAPQSHVFSFPPSLTFEQAAAVPINYYTSYVALLRRGSLRRGETLVVHGASGGLGLAAVQIGKYLGACVIATGSSDDKLKVVKDLGADYVLNTRGDMRQQIKDLTNGRGADVFLDPVGGDMFDVSMRAIAPGGRIVVVGATSGRYGTPRTNVMLVKDIAVIGVDVGVYRRNAGAQGSQDMLDVMAMIASGGIRPYVGATFPFAQAKEGLGILRERKVVGKCILVNDAPLA